MTLPTATQMKNNFFKDKKGHIVLWQKPNLLISLWALTKFLAFFIHENSLKSGVSNLSTATLFAWSYLEITKGVNYFRRLLGLVVMIVILVGFFQIKK